jgi:MFS family permease
MITQIGPCIGPVIGGALAQGLGWRQVFKLCAQAAGVDPRIYLR